MTTTPRLNPCPRCGSHGAEWLDIFASDGTGYRRCDWCNHVWRQHTEQPDKDNAVVLLPRLTRRRR